MTFYDYNMETERRAARRFWLSLFWLLCTLTGLAASYYVFLHELLSK